MKLKVWTMVPGSTFGGEYFIFETRNKNYSQAVSAAINHCEKTRGYKPEKIEKYQSIALRLNSNNTNSPP